MEFLCVECDQPICEHLDQSDLAMGRVLENLFGYFIKKRFILVSELTAKAIDKLSRWNNL